MEIAGYLGLLVGSLIRVYPETRLFRKILSRLSNNNNSLIILTAASVIFINVLIMALTNYSAEQIISFIILDSIALAIFSYIDSERTKEDSKIIFIIRNTGFRVTLRILLFTFIFFMSDNLLPLIGVIDPYYITPFLLAFVYTYFALKTNKNRNNKENLSA